MFDSRLEEESDCGPRQPSIDQVDLGLHSALVHLLELVQPARYLFQQISNDHHLAIRLYMFPTSSGGVMPLVLDFFQDRFLPCRPRLQRLARFGAVPASPGG